MSCGAFSVGDGEMAPLFHSVALQQYIILCSQVWIEKLIISMISRRKKKGVGSVVWGVGCGENWGELVGNVILYVML